MTLITQIKKITVQTSDEKKKYYIRNYNSIENNITTYKSTRVVILK
jgi:hypothetical protein